MDDIRYIMKVVFMLRFLMINMKENSELNCKYVKPCSFLRTKRKVWHKLRNLLMQAAFYL